MYAHELTTADQWDYSSGHWSPPTNPRFADKPYRHLFADMLRMCIYRGNLEPSSPDEIKLSGYPFRFAIYMREEDAGHMRPRFGLGFIPTEVDRRYLVAQLANKAFRQAAIGGDWDWHPSKPFILPLDPYPPTALMQAANEIDLILHCYDRLMEAEC